MQTAKKLTSLGGFNAASGAAFRRRPHDQRTTAALPVSLPLYIANFFALCIADIFPPFRVGKSPSTTLLIRALPQKHCGREMC